MERNAKGWNGDLFTIAIVNGPIGFVIFHAYHGKESRQHPMIVEVADNDLLQRLSPLGSALRPQNGIVFVTMAQPARHFEECSEAAKLLSHYRCQDPTMLLCLWLSAPLIEVKIAKAFCISVTPIQQGSKLREIIHSPRFTPNKGRSYNYISWFSSFYLI